MSSYSPYAAPHTSSRDLPSPSIVEQSGGGQAIHCAALRFADLDIEDRMPPFRIRPRTTRRRILPRLDVATLSRIQPIYC